MNEPIKLLQSNLDLLPDNVATPQYDREDLQEEIVHIGVGGFHRAHQAFYTDELIGNYNTKNWGICGIGLREEDQAMYQALKQQDYLYTVLVKYPNGKTKPKVIGSIKNYILAPDNPQKAINKMVATSTKIVTLTITEGGYNFNDSTGEFDFTNSDVQWDLAHPDQPKTVFGYLAAALKKRKAKDLPAFTLQSCDNIQKNGDVTQQMLLAFTYELDADLAEWIDKKVSFPNSMVDRITPVTTPDDIEELKKEYHIDDSWPVVCESFKQWIIEDSFVDERPQWEKVGVQFVPNVEPYEKMKLRLLNAGHSLLGIVGTLCGYSTIREAVSDPLLETMLREFLDTEVTPTLEGVKGVDLEDYKESLIERFVNPNIQDKLSRICSESSAKLPKFLLPTIKEQIKQEGDIDKGCAVIAAWFQYLKLDGKLNSGDTYSIEDTMSDLLQEKIQEAGSENPSLFLQIEEIFGDLSNSERFTKLYLSMVDDIQNHGVRRMIKSIVNSD